MWRRPDGTVQMLIGVTNTFERAHTKSFALVESADPVLHSWTVVTDNFWPDPPSGDGPGFMLPLPRCPPDQHASLGVLHELMC